MHLHNFKYILLKFILLKQFSIITHPNIKPQLYPKSNALPSSLPQASAFLGIVHRGQEIRLGHLRLCPQVHSQTDITRLRHQAHLFQGQGSAWHNDDPEVTVNPVPDQEPVHCGVDWPFWDRGELWSLFDNGVYWGRGSAQDCVQEQCAIVDVGSGDNYLPSGKWTGRTPCE